MRAPKAESTLEGLESALLQSIPNPLLAIDSGDTIRFANTAAEVFFEMSAKTLSGLAFGELLPFSSPLAQLLEAARNATTSINEYGVSVGTPKAGGNRIVDVQAASVPEHEGMVILMFLQRSVAQKIDRQLSHRGAARTVTGMASMLAHEIRNPLSGIRGAAQLLEPALGDPANRELTQLICAETDRIKKLVDQMEVFSDERPVSHDPVNIHGVLDHVKKLAVNGFGRGIEIEEVYDPSLPDVRGNREQLIQVFLNLVKNAAEAIDPAAKSRKISLSTAYRPGVRLNVSGSNEKLTLPLEVCVRDTGKGIAPDLLSHLFEPFVTTKGGGKGLGLALVAKLVRGHGGMIDCESNEHGTNFRVLLPMMPTAESRTLLGTRHEQ